MRIIVNTVDGTTHYSDYYTRSEIEPDLKYPETFESAIEKLKSYVKDFKNCNFFYTTIGGKERYFNPANIVWIEVDEED